MVPVLLFRCAVQQAFDQKTEREIQLKTQWSYTGPVSSRLK